MAIEILENNCHEEEIVLAGINNNGMAFAELLYNAMKTNTLVEPELILTQLKLNPANPIEEEVKNGEGLQQEKGGNQAVRRKRLIYRSKQRGWLEVDLLLGTWANENVPNLSNEELNQFEEFVNMETIDIYNVITLRTDIPIEMQNITGGHIVEKIQEWCKTSPLGKADIEKYKKVKAEKNLI